jgi:hypothetical protein
MVALSGTAEAAQNPVATNDAEYMVFGRAFPDPQGCGNNPIGQPPGISPWAKGNVCATQFLTYDEVLTGSRYLESKHERYLQIIRLDQAYDDPEMKSAGIPKDLTVDEDGKVQVVGREKRPLYLFKVTDSESPIPEKDRKHFAISMSIHGIERAGLEGGIRAMEDLVTWAHCETDPASAPACADEGPFPKKIVETPTDKPVPTAGDTLKNSVIYFFDVNPDGWGRGEVSNGGVFFQRYNGNSVDINRDWPTQGYTYKPFSPGSEPETKAYEKVLQGIKRQTSEGRFTGGIDLHGQLTAVAFSYTLLGAGQRDFRRNFSSVDQALRTWQDQSQRMGWSPYIGDTNRNGVRDTGDRCAADTFCIADQWGTVVDTLGYQITGGIGDWMDSDKLGLGAVGIDNEMSLSHLAPNIGYETINEQMHVDGNKGLIYSQLAALLNEQKGDFDYSPPGKVGYVHNPKRLSHEGGTPVRNPDLPAQNTISALLPCEGGECNGGKFAMSGTAPTLEFDVRGPDRGVFNGGLSVTATFPNAQGISPAAATTRIALDHFDEGNWHTIAQSNVSESTYLTAGQIVTTNDPAVGKWRVRLTSAATLPSRVTIDFRQAEAESGAVQAPFSASSMDFFDDLNKYIPDSDRKMEAVAVRSVIDDYSTLKQFDSLVVVNEALPTSADAAGNPLGLSDADRERYFANLKRYAESGGNLVLTDGALKAAPQLGLAPATAVKSSQPSGRGAVPRVSFNLGGARGNLCDPATTDALVKDVCLPGSAGGSARQVMEPVPLGYTPDTGVDSANNNKITQHHIDRSAWEAGCGDACTSGLLSGGTALGKRPFGAGEVRIAGALLPDPNYNPNATRDMRFGVASYSLAPAGWQMFLNLIDYQRPKADLSVAFTQAPGAVDAGRDATWALRVANGGPAAAPAVRLAVTMPDQVELTALPTGCTFAAHVASCDLGSLAAGQQRELSFTGIPHGPGSLATKAVVSTDGLDPTAANDSATSRGNASCTITGTGSADLITGTEGADVICGLAGKDDIRGLGENDVLVGGPGDDTLYGHYGDDLIVGGTGSDWHNGGPDVDTCRRQPDDTRNSNCEK